MENKNPLNKKVILSITIPILIIAVGALVLFAKQRNVVPTEGVYKTSLDSKTNVRELAVLSQTYTVDQLYKSMKGPQSNQEVYLFDPDKPELIWITGYKAVIVGADGESQLSQEFMCHSNLDINMTEHKKLFKWRKNNPSTRLFTLSQGQFEIDFPEGFAIPIMSNEALSLTTQVLNLNDPANKFNVRHKVTFSYILDKELPKPMKPMIQLSAFGMKLLEGNDGFFNVANADEQTHGSSCLIGENAGDREIFDTFRRKFTGHWVVEPGREVNHTLATKLLNLPYDTTAHYIAVHLHPFAESLELKDLTTGEIVFKSDVENAKDKIGLKRVQYFTSNEGLKLYKDHEYQVTSVYNNTSDEPQDSMAVMFLYVLDKEFQRPDRTAKLNK